MKKFSLFLVFVMLIGALSLVGCGSSEEPASGGAEGETDIEEPAEEKPAEELPEDNPLVGTWAYEGNMMNDRYVYNADGTGEVTFVLSGNEVKHNFTYTIDGNKVNITFETGDDQTDEFKVDGSKLLITSESGDEIEYDKVE